MLLPSQHNMPTPLRWLATRPTLLCWILFPLSFICGTQSLNIISDGTDIAHGIISISKAATHVEVEIEKGKTTNASEWMAVSPAWGSLPAEQYLMDRWDHESAMAPADQREQLIRTFIQEDTISLELNRSPSEEQVNSILQPWRAQELRPIAQQHSERDPYGCYFILRTYYGGGEADDAKLQEWLDQDPSQGFEIAEHERSWQVLDNAALFDVGGDDGEDWQRVYHVLPELAAPGRERQPPGDFDYVREMATMHNDDPEDEDLEFWILTMAVTGNWLLVADRHAFENDELRLVFRDNKGNVVKESRIRPDALGELALSQLQGNVHESEYWLDGEVGEHYETGGQTMRELLHRARQ